jgi:pilus assembly protein CpaF
VSGRFSQLLTRISPPPQLDSVQLALMQPPPFPFQPGPPLPQLAVDIDPPVSMPITMEADVLSFDPPLPAEPGEGAIAEMPLEAPLPPETTPPPAPPPTAVPAVASSPATTSKEPNLLISEKFMEAKVRLHRKLIEEVNLQALEKLAPEEAKRQIFGLVQQYVVSERLALNSAELSTFVSEIIDEMTGLGPLEPLLKDDTIADILINGPDVVYVERRGKMERTTTRFRDDAHLMRIVNKIVSAVGRRVDESQPLCDARLLDGSRVNVAVKPIAVDGALVSIRKFTKSKLSLHKLVEVGAMRQPMYELLSNAARCKTTIIISGGTGSGKTTMLNALSAFIPEDERLITIEDAAELQLQQPHVARMETRPPNLEGKGEIRQRDLIKNALRMRPDRVILGECRGEEAFDMLQAMNTGHEGSMATIHANNPREAVSRLEQMIGMAGLPMSQTSIRSQISAAVRVIVQLQRMSDGKRRVTSIAEITGMEGDILQMQEIFKFVRVKTDADGTIHGHFEATGVRPRFLNDLAAKGVTLPGHYFEPGKAL